MCSPFRPEQGNFVRLARMVWRRALATAKPRISSSGSILIRPENFRVAGPVRQKIKISASAELPLTIGYYGAAG
jgi:hypothetical protein